LPAITPETRRDHLTTPDAPTTAEVRKVIIASSAGTLIEWYDFFIYGSLAVVFSGFFFPAGEESLALLISIAAFGTGFVVRPLGRIVFGRLGDKLGRKRSFLATLLLHWASPQRRSACSPPIQQWGSSRQFCLVLLRLLQGLAVGGEYGGAAIYIAEYSPAKRRGTYTSFLQTTADRRLPDLDHGRGWHPPAGR
jgi:MFS family permease